MFLILIALCFILYWWLSDRNSSIEPPVLSGALPIVGHAYLAWGDNIDYKLVERLTTESEEKGGVFRSFFGPVTVYGITDPDDALTVSNQCLRKHFIYDFAKVLLKTGLIIADEQTWKKNRKLLNPTFTYQVLLSLLDTFNSQTRRLLDMFSHEEGRPFDHGSLIRTNLLETLCLSAFDADSKEFGDLQELYLPNWEKMLKTIDERARKPWFNIDILFNMSSLKRKQDQYVEVTSKLAKSIINKKISTMAQKESTGNESEDNSFMRTLIRLVHNGLFTEEEMQGEIETMIAAGHETSSTVLTVALTAMGSYPEVQEKVYQEIIKIFGDSDRNIEKEDLSQLNYLEAVIKECMRLYPPAPGVGRVIQQDIKLKNYTLKANRGVFIMLYSINRDKIWGPDRHQFRPERWLEKDSLPDPKYYAAFSLGKRSCIGKTYAMISMKVVLVHVLRRYKISSDISKMVQSCSLTVRPSSGHDICIQKRCKGEIVERESHRERS